MPGYKAHVTINVSVLTLGAALSAKYLDVTKNTTLTAVLSFLVATVLLSPDLDLAVSNPTKNWGILRLLWAPYQIFFKHRGWSHSVFLSSFTRIFYLFLLGAVACFAAITIDQMFSSASSTQDAMREGSYAFVDVIKRSWTVAYAYRASLNAAVLGIFLSDLLHIMADRAVSRHR